MLNVLSIILSYLFRKIDHTEYINIFCMDKIMLNLSTNLLCQKGFFLTVEFFFGFSWQFQTRLAYVLLVYNFVRFVVHTLWSSININIRYCYFNSFAWNPGQDSRIRKKKTELNLWEIVYKNWLKWFLYKIILRSFWINLNRFIWCKYF